MKRTSILGPLALGLTLVVAGGAAPGCNCSGDVTNGDGGGNGDGGNNGDGGGGTDGPNVNACGDNDPSCTVVCIGPTCMPPGMFPLPTDNPPPDNVKADGVSRNPNGYIVLDASKASFDFLWIANSEDFNNMGTVSKIDTKVRPNPPAGAVNGPYREVARYLTVTCRSDPDPAKWGTPGVTLGTTATATCDAPTGVGCCAKTLGGAKSAIQVIRNYPSRTAVDYNGDVWVGNRAHGAAPNQPSVTKIANRNNSISDTDCIDRNKNGKIDTSFDANGDGIINTDCDQNGVPDDLSAEAACTAAGRPLEFYGLDDECVLFTTNTSGSDNGIGRPLTLGPSGIDPNGPSDAWAGLFNDNSATGTGTTFVRISGKDGSIIGTLKIQPVNGFRSRPYGAVVDQFGILWAPNIEACPGGAATCVGGQHSLFYVNTNPTTGTPSDAANQGLVQPPQHANGGNGIDGFYGIAIDGYEEAGQLVQQVWLGHYTQTGAYRFRPVRNAGFAGIKNGSWAEINVTGSTGSGRGVGVDNRKPTAFAWVGLDAPGSVLRIPTNIGSSVMNTVHTLTTTEVFAAGNAQNGTIGTGVAANLDIWAIHRSTDAATHFKVDPTGNVTAPGVTDQVLLDDNRFGAPAHGPPRPYTYSDFTGFGLRNFTNPRGTYTWRQIGCGAAKTKWLKVLWDGDTPLGTKISIRVRSADDVPALQQAMYYGTFDSSPADLQLMPGPVLPNPSGFLEVEFILSTIDKNSSPALKSFQILYECVNSLG